MNSLAGRTSRVIIAALLMLPMLAAPAKVPAPTPAKAAGETPSAYHQETRLRKLHLVRPDLIPYPIAYDVYC